jgi:hypothetical protein
MTEMPAQSVPKTDAKSLNQILTPILIGVVAEVLIGELKALPPSMRLLSVLFVGLVYGGLTNSIRPKKLPISRRAAFILSILFLLVSILIMLASIIMDIDIMQTATLLGWLAVMILSLWVARSLPESGMLARSLLTGAATVSLGAAIVIGGAPVVQFAMMGGTTDILIQNNCDTPLAYADYDLFVPAHGQNSTKFPAVSFTLERSGNQLIAKSQGQKIINGTIDGCKEISVDGQLLRSGDSIALKLQEQKSHVISIDCRAC